MCANHRSSDVAALTARPNDGLWEVPPAGVSAEAAAEAQQHAISLDAVDWDAWLFGEGMPPVQVRWRMGGEWREVDVRPATLLPRPPPPPSAAQLEYDHTERAKVSAHADQWIFNTPTAQAAAPAATAGWVALHWIAFLERVTEVRGGGGGGAS